MADLASLLDEDHDGDPVSTWQVERMLAEVRPHKVRGRLKRADDPAFWIRAGQVCRLYLNPPPGAVLISVDEKTGPLQRHEHLRPSAESILAQHIAQRR